jgi:hypothetical protein
MADTPFGYWRLSEVSGAAINLGSAGSAWNGTYQAGVTRNVGGLIPSQSNAAAYFNPSGDTSEVTLASGRWWTGTAFTIRAVVNLDAVQPCDSATIVGCRTYFANSVNDFPFHISYTKSSGLLTVGIDAGGDYSSDVTLTHSITTATTVYIDVVVREGGICELWVNNVQRMTATFSGNLNNVAGRTWRIGGSLGYAGGTGQHRLKGVIDEVAFFNGALSTTRRTAHFSASGL